MGTTGRWLVPLAASVAVVALVVGVPRAMAPSDGGGGPDRPDAGIVGPRQLLTPSGVDAPEPSRTGRGSVRITGYRATGTVLALSYEVDLADCGGRIARPQVEETRRSVLVTLRRAAAEVRGQDCGEVDRSAVVNVSLSRPLAGRLVRDVRNDGALVPLRMPFQNVQ